MNGVDPVVPPDGTVYGQRSADNVRIGNAPFKRALLLANPAASRFQSAGDLIRARLSAAIEVVEIDCREQKPGELLAAADADYDVVFVAGGDGTVNSILADMVHREQPLGIIPLGTANDFAHTLGIPMDPEAAIDALLAGKSHQVDLGLANGHYFANVASIGLGAAVVGEMEAQEKTLAGVLSYPLALLRAYRDARPLRTRVVTNTGTHRFHVLQLGVGNGHTHGGGIYVSETVSVTDGLFDVYCVRPSPVWRLTFILHALLWQEHRGETTIETFSAKSIDVRTSRRVDVNLDGELLTTTPAQFEVAPGALNVLTPAGWAG